MTAARSTITPPSPSPAPYAGRDRGFTLLEVLVALAILGLAVVAAIQLFAGGLRLLKLAGEHQQATLLADGKARELTSIVEGEESGTEGEFTWHRSVRATEIPPELTLTGPASYRVYAVTVQVRWGDRRSVEVATLRTARPLEPGESAPQ
jgi:general secretion pathway protein I